MQNTEAIVLPKKTPVQRQVFDYGTLNTDPTKELNCQEKSKNKVRSSKFGFGLTMV